MGRDQEVKWLDFSPYPIHFSYTVPLSLTEVQYFMGPIVGLKIVCSRNIFFILFVVFAQYSDR